MTTSADSYSRPPGSHSPPVDMYSPAVDSDSSTAEYDSPSDGHYSPSACASFSESNPFNIDPRASILDLPIELLQLAADSLELADILALRASCKKLVMDLERNYMVGLAVGRSFILAERASIEALQALSKNMWFVTSLQRLSFCTKYIRSCPWKGDYVPSMRRIGREVNRLRLEQLEFYLSDLTPAWEDIFGTLKQASVSVEIDFVYTDHEDASGSITPGLPTYCDKRMHKILGDGGQATCELDYVYPHKHKYHMKVWTAMVNTKHSPKRLQLGDLEFHSEITLPWFCTLASQIALTNLQSLELYVNFVEYKHRHDPAAMDAQPTWQNYVGDFLEFTSRARNVENLVLHIHKSRRQGFLWPLKGLLVYPTYSNASHPSSTMSTQQLALTARRSSSRN